MKKISILLLVFLIPTLVFSKAIRIGVSQIASTSNIEENTEKIMNALEKQNESDVRLVILPEFSLSGFGRFVEFIDQKRLNIAINKIIKKGQQLMIAVALPIIRFENDKKFNSVIMIDKGEILGVVDKVGLGSGFESRIFESGENQSRSILIDGIKIGIILCREMAHDSYEYLNEHDLPDLIVWPSVYAWPESINWNNPEVSWVRRVKDNIDRWNIPVIQSNLVLPLPNSTMITGGSISFDKDGLFLNQGNPDLEDHFYLDIEIE